MSTDPFAFEPSPARTRAIDRDLRGALADSTTLVLREATRAGFAWDGDLDGWARALRETERAPPRLWAAYHALVDAITRGEGDAIRPLATDLLAQSPRVPAPPGTVLALAACDLGATDAARYEAVLDNDPAVPLRLVGASAAEVERVGGLCGAGRDLLGETCPALLDEIDTLGHQIVLADSAEGSRFGGAASVFLWGAVALNPSRVPDRVTLVESLAHEAAHALLFGLTRGVDLTANDPAARYASPLRADPRPMEGLVHATYVLARMCYALHALQRSARLDEVERALVRAKLAANRARYDDGLSTVTSHAVFTAEGVIIFERCVAAMR